MSYAFTGSPIYPINAEVRIEPAFTTDFASLVVRGDASDGLSVFFLTNDGKGSTTIDSGGSVNIQQSNSFGATPALRVVAAPTGLASIQEWQTGVFQVGMKVDSYCNLNVHPPIGNKFTPALVVVAGTTSSAVQTWTSNATGFRGNIFPRPADLTVSSTGALVITPNGVGQALTVQGDYTPLSLSTVANAVSTELTLTSVAAAVNGLAVYTGTITGGANNAFAGYSFAITGFTLPSNNTFVGTGPPTFIPYSYFVCVASTATTLTLQNAFAASETHAATATYGSTVYTSPNITVQYVSEGVEGLPITGIVPTPSAGTTTYTATLPAFSNFVDQYLTITGCSNASNNGTFLCVANDTTSLTLQNPQGVIETPTTVGPFTLTSVANAAEFQTIYTGTITGGAANAFAGYVFNIAGFTNTGNNGSFFCLASSATTLTLISNGLAESAAATASGSLAFGTSYTESLAWFFNPPNSNPFTTAEPVVFGGGFTNFTYLNNLASFTTTANTIDSTVVTLPTAPSSPVSTLTSVATSTPVGPFTLTQVNQITGINNPVTTFEYIGTITGGAGNAFFGYQFTITGFSNLGNNQTNATCISSTDTKLVFQTGGSTETAAGSASGGFTVYTGTITGGAANALRGHSFTVGAFSTSANNGLFVCAASSATTLTLGNPDAVSETNPATAIISGNPLSFEDSTTITAVLGTTNQYAGLWVVTQGWQNAAGAGFNASKDPANGTFLCTASDATTVTLLNPLATAETQYSLLSTVSNGSPAQSWSVYGSPIPSVTTGNSGVTTTGFVASIKTKTANYTALPSDYTINCSGTFTVTLPTTGLTIGQIFQIKNVGVGTITVSSAANIDFATSATLNAPGQSIAVQWDGTQYWIY
jgi:hypothetical protein